MTDQTHDIAALVRARIEELGLNMSQVSLRLGRNRAYIHQFLERGIPKRLPGSARSQLAEILDIDEGQLVPPGVKWTGSSRQQKSQRSEVQRLGLHGDSSDIPILGTSFSSEGAVDFEFTGEIIDYLRCPLALAKAKGCVAIRVVGDAMVPRFEPGNLVVMQAGRAPILNDYIVVELNAGEGGRTSGYLRRLTAYSSDRITCEQFNPVRKTEFKLSDIKTLFRVISTDELLGAVGF
jgi:phage repressor protein C with HTH and peptisase S24 domain